MTDSLVSSHQTGACLHLVRKKFEGHKSIIENFFAKLFDSARQTSILSATSHQNVTTERLQWQCELSLRAELAPIFQDTISQQHLDVI